MLHAHKTHIEKDIHFVEKRVVSKHMVIKYVPFTLQIVDTLTKPLGTSFFRTSLPN